MALFKRADLEKQGLTPEQITYIMTESGRSLGVNYALKSDIQQQIDDAVAKAKAESGAPADITGHADYIKLQTERDMLRAIGGTDFAGVKPKFRETVYGMLDHSEDAPAVSEQLKTIGEQYEEYFSAPAPAEPPAKPQFGAPTKGGAPTGKTGPSFSDAWSFIPKK